MLLLGSGVPHRLKALTKHKAVTLGGDALPG
jgi:hypothetical protein